MFSIDIQIVPGGRPIEISGISFENVAILRAAEGTSLRALMDATDSLLVPDELDKTPEEDRGKPRYDTASDDTDMFAKRNFNLVVGPRGILDLMGNERSSQLICTDFPLAVEIALAYGLEGKLSPPHIWKVFMNEK